MFAVSELAKKYQVSRTTLLYYEKEGLLKPHSRSAKGYRQYSEQEAKRLEAILAYRSYGIPVNKILPLLENKDYQQHEQILKSQFSSLEKEIQKLRLQQKAIVLLLEQPNLLEKEMVNKDRWVDIMQAAGFTEQDMKNWHQQFEKMEPEGHQEFLELLNIEEEEIKQIRLWSQE